MNCKWLISALLAFSIAPCAVAQMHGGGFGRGVGFSGRSGRGFGRSAVFFGSPFLYSDYSSGPPVAEVPRQPVFFLQQPSAAAAPEPKREPVLIELQGDRYVRFSGDAPDHSPDDSATRSAHVLGGSSSGPVTIAVHELPPAVLVFRDGHQEQVRDYIIASGTLYARGDYWQSGSWRKDIQLSQLDIPATLIANQNHGVKFILPSGPNEVVTRP
jgi:hypothetical protein